MNSPNLRAISILSVATTAAFEFGFAPGHEGVIQPRHLGADLDAGLEEGKVTRPLQGLRRVRGYRLSEPEVIKKVDLKPRLKGTKSDY